MTSKNHHHNKARPWRLWWPVLRRGQASNGLQKAPTDTSRQLQVGRMRHHCTYACHVTGAATLAPPSIAPEGLRRNAKEGAVHLCAFRLGTAPDHAQLPAGCRIHRHENGAQAQGRQGKSPGCLACKREGRAVGGDAAQRVAGCTLGVIVRFIGLYLGSHDRFPEAGRGIDSCVSAPLRRQGTNTRLNIAVADIRLFIAR
jgi:hypothetical protein